MRLSPAVFLLLVAVELLLLAAARSRRTRIASAARIAVFAFPLALAVALRIYQAFSTHEVLEWDETYYMSLAVTAAHGGGLYPYVFGFGPMPVMGGVGYAAYAYVLAVLVAGPTVLGLRAVSVLASLIGLAGVWVLVRKWYGSGTAWIATALASVLRLFVMSNSARMDSLTFAWVIWSVLMVAVAFERWHLKRWHLLAGLAFGLGLQVHIDTAVTAGACGVLYLVMWARDAVAKKRAVLPSEMLLYVLGWCVGLLIFICFNILPDPAAFYRTTVLVRVDATHWYSSGTSSIFASFLNPHILMSKELARYGVLLHALPAIEVLLFLGGLVATLVRRSTADTMALTIIAGVLVAAAVVLNNASPLYYIHVTPALIIPMAPLLTHGLARKSRVSTGEVGFASMLAFIIVVSALLAVNNAKSVRRAPRPAAQEAADAQLVRRVRSAVDRRCRIAGDGSLYVRYFADYPYFISSRPTEVKYAMLYFGASAEADYWDIKAPDVVFAREPLSDGLSVYVSRHHLRRVDEGLWAAPGGCAAGG